MRLYQLLFKIGRPIHLKPEDVRLVYIDDDTHWSLLNGDEPTSRKYLAALVINASKPLTKAAVIGLDVELLAPLDDQPGHDASERSDDDQKLFDAIQSAANQGVPVVLASVYYQDENLRNRLLPNIYADRDVFMPKGKDCAHISCPSFGYINLPVDKRLVPLAREVVVAGNGPAQKLESFAQVLAEAKLEPFAIQRQSIPTDSTPEDDDRTFGNFLPEEQYETIPITKLAIGDQEAENQCAGKIVLIGGHWHELEGFGKLVDQHLSPAGSMSGLGLHANYVETLLQHQSAHEWPLWFDIIIDLLVGLIVYTLFEIWHAWWKITLLLVGVSCLPLLIAYISLVTLNVYLDFVLPIELYFLHIVYELVYEAVKAHFQARTQKPTPLLSG